MTDKELSFIDHIAIRVSDIHVSEEWYLKHLKAEVVFRDNKYIRLKVKNTYISLIDEKYYPYNHIGILVENQDELPSDIGKIVEHRDGTVGCYVVDPHGNYIEYIWYKDKNNL